MGTKQKPSRFDCYANAMPDEPIFVLLGRDVEAPSVIEYWADRRWRRLKRTNINANDQAMIDEANEIAQAMRDWRASHSPEAWRTYVPETSLNTFSADSMAFAILKDILVHVFENDGNVSEHFDRYRPKLAEVIQKWKGGYDGRKSEVLTSAHRVLNKFNDEGKRDLGQFVWLQGFKGPVGQVWFTEKQFQGEKQLIPLQKHPLTQLDLGKTIDELEKTYPFDMKNWPVEKTTATSAAPVTAPSMIDPK